MTTLRIMVIDDDRDTADSTATLLQILGHEVTVAYAGSVAVEAAKDCEPDIVLLDIGMPEMDGFEVARRLREQTRAALVAISGFGREADVARAKEAGVDHYLIKPIDLDQMQAVLSEQIANKAGECFHCHPYSALRHVSCESTDGKLILRGSVRSYFLKQLAQESVGQFDGAMIDNQIQVEWKPGDF
jgi:DNA-binding response OmpR family regulator